MPKAPSCGGATARSGRSCELAHATRTRSRPPPCPSPARGRRQRRRRQRRELARCSRRAPAARPSSAATRLVLAPAGRRLRHAHGGRSGGRHGCWNIARGWDGVKKRAACAVCSLAEYAFSRQKRAASGTIRACVYKKWRRRAPRCRRLARSGRKWPQRGVTRRRRLRPAAAPARSGARRRAGRRPPPATTGAARKTPPTPPPPRT